MDGRGWEVGDGLPMFSRVIKSLGFVYDRGEMIGSSDNTMV